MMNACTTPISRDAHSEKGEGSESMLLYSCDRDCDDLLPRKLVYVHIENWAPSLWITEINSLLSFLIWDWNNLWDYIVIQLDSGIALKLSHFIFIQTDALVKPNFSMRLTSAQCTALGHEYSLLHWLDLSWLVTNHYDERPQKEPSRHCLLYPMTSTANHFYLIKTWIPLFCFWTQ